MLHASTWRLITYTTNLSQVNFPPKILYEIRCNNNYLICHNIESEINAKLIAASPKLLQALKMCLNGGYKYKTIEAFAQEAIAEAEYK